MTLKGAESWINQNLISNNLLLIFLMILIVIVIIDCNTKMFSKMIEGNSTCYNNNSNNNSNLSCTECGSGSVCGRDCTIPQKNPTNSQIQNCDAGAAEAAVYDKNTGNNNTANNNAGNNNAGNNNAGNNNAGNNNAGNNSGFNVSGYDDELVLYASADKPLGPVVPRTMQQDYTVLKAFGLTKMPEVINYIPGPAPSFLK